MANAVYPIWKQNLIQGATNTDLDGISVNGVFCAMLDAGYSYSAAHDFYDDVGITANVIGTPQEVGATKSYTNGTFDGSDVTYSSVSGNQVTQLVLFRKNSGATSTQYLVLFLDTSVTGLPVTPNGGDITIQWNASGIFTISDAEAKENIREVGHIGQAKVYAFNYKGKKERVVGLIAQQVEQFAPRAVRQFGKYKQVNYLSALKAA